MIKRDFSRAAAAPVCGPLLGPYYKVHSRLKLYFRYSNIGGFHLYLSELAFSNQF
jgi:hypothetical protein